MRRLLIGLVLLILAAQPCLACLRDTADARAIQWSTLIVDAKLTSVGDPISLASPYSCRVYQFQVTQTLDGTAPDGPISVLRFFAPQGTGNTVCGMLSTDAVGKS